MRVIKQQANVRNESSRLSTIPFYSGSIYLEHSRLELQGGTLIRGEVDSAVTETALQVYNVFVCCKLTSLRCQGEEASWFV